MFCLRTIKMVSLRELIYHEFYLLLALIYRCFRDYYMCLLYALECFQVQVHFGELWWVWSFLRCRTAQMRQMFSYELRPFYGAIEPIFWHKIYLWVIFPMPLVWGQLASYSRIYARFTEEWYVCLARESCRGDEGMSIDGAPLVSIDGDSRMQAEYISRST